MNQTLQSQGPPPTTARQREIAALAPWFHNLHLPDGAQTAPDHPLGDFPSFKWSQIAPHLPEDLSGWRALDIGCNAGFYSVELARRGASVVGIDPDPHYLRQARWAAEEFGLDDRLEFRRMQVYDLACEEPSSFDLVLFLGVFYHLRYPLLGLDVVSRLVRRLMVFQTLSMPGDEVVEAPPDLKITEREALTAPGWPRMAFLEHRLADDPTNWWAPNASAIEAMLRSSGLEVAERPGHEIYICRPAAGRRRDGLIETQYLSATGRPWQDRWDEA
jgi:tRNA (mo5U34)-methyltransferase